jgi:hypothetical protein
MPSGGTLATVRAVRHPIAMFVMAVLGVVAIGVGVLAASGGAGFVMAPNLTEGASRAYGPPGLQFVAAFPGTPTCGMEQHGSTFVCHVGHSLHKYFSLSVTNTGRLPEDAYDEARAGLSLSGASFTIRRAGTKGRELPLLCGSSAPNVGIGAYDGNDHRTLPSFDH